MLLKFLTFLIVCYLLYRLFGAFFRIVLFTLGARNSFARNQQQEARRARRPVGNIQVDYVPEESKQSEHHYKRSDGEYVDYEEVK